MSDDDRQDEPRAPLPPSPRPLPARGAPAPAGPGFRSVHFETDESGWEEGPTNETQRYAPGARPVGQQLRSTLTELDDVLPPGRSAWDVSTNHTQQYGHSPQPGGTASPDGGWNAPSNRTQQYATPASSDGSSLQRPAAASPWSLPGNDTQQYAPSEATTADGPNLESGPNTDLGPWGAPTNQTQQYARDPVEPRAAEPAPAHRLPQTSPWGDGNNATQRFAAAPRPTVGQGHSLAPPRQESTDPWGSANNNTALYARPGALGPGPLSLRSDLDGAPVAPDDEGAGPEVPAEEHSERPLDTPAVGAGMSAKALDAHRPGEGTEPNPPAPRSKTEPYGVPLSSHEGEAEDGPGPRPSSLEEAARQAADEVRPHRPAPRPAPQPAPVAFAEIELDDDTETLDTDASPADAWIVTEGGRAPRPPAGAARFAELHLDESSDGWALSPPSGVNRADTSGPHWPRATSPEDFALEPPQTDSGADD